MQNLDITINELKKLAGKNINTIPLPDDDLINDYEKEINFKFSEDYKKVLKNLSNVFFGTIELLSVTREKKYPTELSFVLREARKVGVPLGWLPICEDNGDYYCLLPNGTIRFWSHDGVTDEKWDDLASWIKEVWINKN